MEEKNNGIDFTNEFKKVQDRLKWNERVESVKRFCSDNKEWLLAVGIPLAGSLLGGIVKGASKHATARREDHHRDCQIYDNRSGVYFETRRKMTNSERLEYSRRRDNGEHVADILRDMRILK